MHSFGYRANALLTFAITILALMCAMASLSDNLNSPTPSAQVQVSLSLPPLYQFPFCGSIIQTFFHHLIVVCFLYADVGVEY